MSLTKGQKKRRDRLVEAAQNAATPAEVEALWNTEDFSQIVHWTRVWLLSNEKMWAAVRPFYQRDTYQMGHTSPEVFEALLKNNTLSDQDLVEFKVAEKEPLSVLRHPNCGDQTLRVVAEIWERSLARNMDCLPGYASGEQVSRMYELRPSCKEHNATTGDLTIANRVVRLV